MSKSKEELDAHKKDVEAVNEKLAELTPEEIAQVTGGGIVPHDPSAEQVIEPDDPYVVRHLRVSERPALKNPSVKIYGGNKNV